MPSLNKQEIQKRFGQRVKEIREKKGLTKTEVADLMGNERQRIREIEEGESNLTLEKIVKLAQALEVTPADLMKFKLD